MKKNISITDRRIRLALGSLLLLLGVYFQSWWGILGLPLIVTALLNTCVIYMLLGISTKDESGETCSIEQTPENKESTPETPQAETDDQKPL